ncbi:MAG: AraC family transcriptional regulator ligand-binding domain-containing protein [Myxococcales bacterium]|nr:AraC family transcriptional regulator ligand-binding domain-containing protein [Myxococcales bacterium]
MRGAAREPTVGPQAVHLLVWAMRDHHVDVLQRAAELGLPREALAAKGLRIPVSLVNALWEFVVDQTGRPWLGFEIAQQTNFAATLLPLAIFQNSPNLRQAYTHWARFRGLMNQGVRDEMVEDGSRAWFRASEAHGCDLTPAWADFLLARALRMVRDSVCMPGLDALEVRLTRPGPLDPRLRAVVEGFFRGPVYAGMPWNAFALTSEVLDAPFVNASPHILRALLTRAELMLDELPGALEGDALVARVRQCLTNAMLGGDPSLAATAAHLARSPRTLQRQLSHAGSSHQALLDEVRETAARAYLGPRGLSVQETSLLLGYSEISGFHRAFRRWTGTTPATYVATWRETPRDAHRL